MDTPELAAAIGQLQVKRKWTIKLTIKLMNSTSALARRYCGFAWDAEEGEREKVNRRAASIIARAMNCKPQAPEDAEIADFMAQELELLKHVLGPVDKRRDIIEGEMKKLARQLPVYPWAKDVKGLGDLGLAVIAGEAGDLSRFPNIRHLWKRLGFAPFDGKSMSRWRIEGGLSAEMWEAAGYSPKRRAEIYGCVQDSFFRHQSASSGPYHAIYKQRRAHCEANRPQWMLDKNGKPLSGGGKGHYHDDATRVMTKALLKDLWVEWKRCDGTVLTNDRWASAAE